MTALHTPGPWFAVDAESMKYCSVVEFEYGSGARGTVGLVGTDGVTVGASSLDEQNANARLISVAPDLLTLVHQYRDDLIYPIANTGHGSRERRIEAIDAVLAKVSA